MHNRHFIFNGGAPAVPFGGRGESYNSVTKIRYANIPSLYVYIDRLVSWELSLKWTLSCVICFIYIIE
jgi:hypothetical protein